MEMGVEEVVRGDDIGQSVDLNAISSEEVNQCKVFSVEGGLLGECRTSR